MSSANRAYLFAHARTLVGCAFRRFASLALIAGKRFKNLRGFVVVGKARARMRRENDPPFPAPRSGEGGPREARWKGRPLHHAPHGPPPPCNGGGRRRNCEAEERIIATKSECSELAVSAPDDAHAVAAIARAPPARVSRAGAMHVARLLEGLPYAPLPARAPLSFPASLLLGPQARHAAGGMGEGGSAVPTVARAFRHRPDVGIGGLMAVLTNPAGLARGPRRR